MNAKTHPRALPQTRTGRSVSKSMVARLRLTNNDAWLLVALANMRFLTTTQLARLYFSGSRSSANKRLRALFNAGYLKVWVRGLAQDNVYSIARGAVGVIWERLATLDFRITVPRQLDGNLEHNLSVNQIHVALALSLSDVGGELRTWRSDWDLRGLGHARVVPDALFTICWDDDRFSNFALEMDRHTRSPRYFLRKLMGYRSVPYICGGLYGLHAVTILVVGQDPRWLERYRQSLAHVRLAVPAWFAPLDDIETLGPLAAIWRSTADDTKYSLRALPFAPYGKEQLDEEEHAASQSYTPTPARQYPYETR